MPVTGIYHIPAQGADPSPLNNILSRLHSTYAPNPLPSWSLTHRLFRETPTQSAADTKPKPSTQQRYLQILSLSHHAPHTHVAITTTHTPSQTRAGTPASSNISSGADAASGEPATIVTIPAGAQSEEFTQLVVAKFAAQWQQRQVLHVSNGLAFEIGEEFRVRVGELRQGGGGGAQMGRGAVVEVQWVGGSEEGVGEEKEDWENGETVIGAFWDGLGIKGAKKVFWVAGLGEGEESVRQWCDILRIRT